MSARPPVSVVISNYNLRDYVGRAITSALSGTLPGVEVVVVDDGSTDGSREVLAGYADRITLIEQPNGGQGSAINNGYAQSTAPYVCFLDGDDELLPDALARCVAAFEANPAVGKVSFRLAVTDADGRRLGPTVPPAHVRPPSGDIRARMRDSSDSWFTPQSGNVYRRTMLERLLPLDSKLFLGGGDYWLNRGCALLAPVIFIDEVLGLYRRHGGNMGLHEKMDLTSLRRTFVRNVKAQILLTELAEREGLDYPPGWARRHDPVLLSQIIVSRRRHHPGRAAGARHVVRGHDHVADPVGTDGSRPAGHPPVTGLSGPAFGLAGRRRDRPAPPGAPAG